MTERGIDDHFRAWNIAHRLCRQQNADACRRAAKVFRRGALIAQIDEGIVHQRVIDEAKTDAGNRDVDLSLDVMEELMAWRAERQPASPDDYVFPTASGRPPAASRCD